ncbi:hypothetical protein DFH94DRAFT_212701 [Russula ochroleuca]|jgi:hypothetical protein|uniref:DUF6534 domain-containing protein n=1 Tax=Russula ochroleuca TaxID=152965 RepID=A0A9P5JZA4_9AGAM|nr:hypothetical protein DFH94DRAFT_212701 [Russula ochroleuca]
MAGPSSSVDVSKIATPLLFGPLVNWALYGSLCVQFYVYVYNFPDDRRALKILAYFVFLLETSQTALTGADVHYWFIQNFGSAERLASSHYAPIDIAIMDSIISLVVQEYFCYRIWTLNKRLLWPCVLIAMVGAVQSTGAAWGGIKSLTLGRYAVSRTALFLWSLPSALADILIAIAMTVLLRQAQAVGHYSNYILLRVVRLTVETNTLTASVAIASFVLYVAFPNEIYYTFTAGIIGKLYSNTLLVSLNNRIYFRDHPFRGAHGNTRCYVDSGRSLRATVTPLTFAQPGLRRHTTSIGDNLKLDVVSAMATVDIEKNTVIGDSPDPSHSGQG